MKSAELMGYQTINIHIYIYIYTLGVIYFTTSSYSDAAVSFRQTVVDFVDILKDFRVTLDVFLSF